MRRVLGESMRSAAVGLAAAAVALIGPGTTSAETFELDFLRIAPLPEGIEAIKPMTGAVNVRFQDCEAAWPEGYRDWVAESVAAEGHARKRDIYAWLRARQAFGSKDCGCTGKVAAWEDVQTIYSSLRDTHGRVLIKHTADFAARADVLTAAVERMCGGPF